MGFSDFLIVVGHYSAAILFNNTLQHGAIPLWR